MIYSNVHGKNSFRNQIKYFIKELKILTPNNKVILCSSLRNKKLFKSTIGGFGLTGIILSAKIKLLRIKSDHLHQKILEINNYNQFLKMIKTTLIIMFFGLIICRLKNSKDCVIFPIILIPRKK